MELGVWRILVSLWSRKNLEEERKLKNVARGLYSVSNMRSEKSNLH